MKRMQPHANFFMNFIVFILKVLPTNFLKLSCLLGLFFTVGQAYAQTPQAIPYQGVARNESSELLASQNISLRFTIRNGSESGTIVYQETHKLTTSNLGLFNTNIGAGSPVIGTLAAVNWGSGAKFLQVEMDVNGGSAFIDMGTAQFNSVPYALYAEKSNTTAADLGLENVDNTSDSDKPVSTAQQTALNSKEDLINKSSNVNLGTSDVLYPTQNAVKSYVDVGEGILQDKIDAEESRAKLAEQANATNIADNATAISDEATARGNADTTLQNNIDAEASTARAAEQANADAIADNASAISDEVTRATAAEGAIAADLATETNNRTTADTALQGNIDAEASARAAGDAANASAISDEVTRATAAEGAIAADLATETNNRTTADTALQGNIDAEASARAAADAANASSISDEVTRATAAEGAIAADLATETNNRTTADTALQGNIDAEASARAAADAANATAISVLQSEQSTQNAAIALNTAKVGITTAQADAIVANTAKVGLTSEQVTKLSNTSGTNTGDQDILGIAANATAIDALQSEQITQNNAIALNTAKVGITTAQADAIVANTDKVGITQTQADAIVANTAKVGITTAQANAIIANGTAITNEVTRATAAESQKENLSNKSTNVNLGTSDVLYPTQNAVKTYVDTQIANNSGGSSLSASVVSAIGSAPTGNMLIKNETVELSFTVPGATTSGVVVVSPTAGTMPQGAIIAYAYVSANDTVKVAFFTTLNNFSFGSGGQFHIKVIQ